MRKPIIALFIALAMSSAVRAQDVLHGTLDVLTWNIFMRPSGIFFDSQRTRAEHIGRLFLDTEYDILVFQEAFSKPARERMWNILKAEFPFQIEPTAQKGKLFNSGLWVLSKLPVKDVSIDFFKDCKGVDCHASKGALVFEVEKDGHAYQLVNTHLQAEDGPRYAQIRAKQFGQIHAMLEARARPDVTQLILGDLNTDRGNEEDYSEMLAILQGSDGEVCIPEGSLCTTEQATTWGCSNNTLIPSKWRGSAYLLDYALVRTPRSRPRSKLRPTPPWVERALKTFTAEWSSKHNHLSDHYAIAFRILHDRVGEPADKPSHETRLPAH